MYILLTRKIRLVNFNRNYQIVFQCGWAILHSHQKCIRIPFASHSCHHLVLPVLFIKVILVCIWTLWFWICISLVTNNVEHICTCLLTVGISFIVKCLFKSYSFFWSFYYWYLEVLNIFWIWVSSQIYALRRLSPILFLAFPFFFNGDIIDI